MILSMKRGDTRTIPVTVTRDGAVENLTDASLWFTAKTNIANSDRDRTTIQKTIGSGITVVSAAAGTATITILPADTSGLTKETLYVYDIQLKTAAGIVETIDEGTLRVTLDVTRSTT